MGVPALSAEVVRCRPEASDEVACGLRGRPHRPRRRVVLEGCAVQTPCATSLIPQTTSCQLLASVLYFSCTQ